MDDVKLRPYHTIYCGSEAQNQFTELIGTAVKENFFKEIKKAGLFCIMADITPNLSHEDKLSVVVRYVNENGTVKERLLDICTAEDNTRHLATLIVIVLTKSILNVKNIIFQYVWKF